MDVYDQLQSHVPVDTREAQSIAAFLAELERLPRPFDRHAGPVHVTASAIVVGKRGILLHWHKRVGGWLQPGGHIDHDETPDRAALREAEEETGLRLMHADPPFLLHVDVHPGAGGHTHLDLRYLLSVDGQDVPAPNPQESQQVQWFTLTDAQVVADDALAGALLALALKQPPRN